MEKSPALVVAVADDDDARRLPGRLYMYIVDRAAPARARQRRRRRSTASCSTNGTSTSSTTILFVRPAFWLGRLFWKGGDGSSSTASGPTASPPACSTSTGGAVRLQTGYIYHYAFAMLIGVAALVTWYLVWGSALMSGIWILSALLILPIVGALLILTLRGESEAVKNNARWIALWTTLITFVLSLYAWAEFDPAQSGFQLVETA